MHKFYEYEESYLNKLLLISDNGMQVTYEESQQFSAKIQKLVDERCLAFILTSNTAGSILSYLACLQNSIVPILWNHDIDNELLYNLLETYQPRYIFMPDENISKTDIVVFSDYCYSMVKTTYQEPDVLHDDLALCLTTSGSTGSPKLVRQSYDNITANAWQIAHFLKIDSTERPITTLPMHYTYGLSIINSHVLAGATILLTEKSMMDKDFWTFFKEKKATSFGGVPYHYEILERLRFDKMDLPSLRCITQAGGKLSSDLHKRFAEYAASKNIKFIVMYGACEATARMTYLPYEYSLEKYGSIGIAIPDGNLKIIDINGNEIREALTPGELLYEGPNVTLGYANCIKDLSKGDEWHGQLLTGDIAQKDDAGFYYIIGRKKRYLKIFGNRINLDEVESLLKKEFHTMECACSGYDDHLYVFILDNSKKNEVQKYLSKKLHLSHRAIKVQVLDNIPKNDYGKTCYATLKELYIEQEK